MSADQPIQYAHSTFEEGVAKLTVQDALPEDDGIYTCLAENSAGRASCSAQVIVKGAYFNNTAGFTRICPCSSSFLACHAAIPRDAFSSVWKPSLGSSFLTSWRKCSEGEVGRRDSKAYNNV